MLQPGGADVSVDHRNVHQYIEKVLDAMLGQGIEIPVAAFREGFSRVFPVSDLRTFSSDEMLNILGNPNEDWSFESESLPFAFSCGYHFLTLLCLFSYL